MSIRFITDSKRVKALRSQHRDCLPDTQPLTSESIDFLFDYIETLETELERTTDTRSADTISSLAETDSYYMARAIAAQGHVDDEHPRQLHRPAGEGARDPRPQIGLLEQRPVA